MAQRRQFTCGDKAPNNGRYIEIGETGTSVQEPKQVKLHAGERFPENSNDDRKWTYK